MLPTRRDRRGHSPPHQLHARGTAHPNGEVRFPTLGLCTPHRWPVSSRLLAVLLLSRYPTPGDSPGAHRSRLGWPQVTARVATGRYWPEGPFPMRTSAANGQPYTGRFWPLRADRVGIAIPHIGLRPPDELGCRGKDSPLRGSRP